MTFRVNIDILSYKVKSCRMVERGLEDDNCFNDCNDGDHRGNHRWCDKLYCD